MPNNLKFDNEIAVRFSFELFESNSTCVMRIGIVFLIERRAEISLLRTEKNKLSRALYAKYL